MIRFRGGGMLFWFGRDRRAACWECGRRGFLIRLADDDRRTWWSCARHLLGDPPFEARTGGRR